MPSILSVSRAEDHSFSKQPQLHLRLIAGEGIEGDAHRGATTQHLYLKRKNSGLPNLAQVHLLSSEFLAELAAAGFALNPGDFGENVLTSGLDLLDLPLGTLLHLGAEAILQVTGLRTPCSQIDAFRPGLQQHCWGPRDGSGQMPRRAGIMSVVLVGGLVHPGDALRVELPPLPHYALGPV